LSVFSFLSGIFGSKREQPLTGRLVLGREIAGANNVISIDDSTLRNHLFVSGRAGSGVTVLTEQMLTQQTEQGRGWIYIDHHADDAMLARMTAQARKHGREDEFLVLDLHTPQSSNSYAILQSGTPEERAVRVLQLLPSAENNPGADFYRQTAYAMLAPLFAAIDATGKVIGLRDLALLVGQLDEEAVLREFLDNVPVAHESRAELLAAIETAKRDNRLVKQVLGGIAGRLYLLSTLKLPNLLDAAAPQILMSDVLAHNKMLYVRLPLMQKDSVTTTIARLVMHDIVTSVFARMHTPARLLKPFLVVMTGFSAYGLSGSSHAALTSAAYSHARAMRVALVPVVDGGWTQISQLSEDGADILSGNTFSKIYFSQPQDEQTSRMHAELQPATLDKLSLGEFVMWQGSAVHRGLLDNSPAEVQTSIARRRSVPAGTARPRLKLTSLVDPATP
jgi:hypothetical protein